MTAGEAAELALVAAALAKPDAVFWLDVGPPVRVLDVARRLAEAATPEAPIALVGLRPGERLHERWFSTGDEVVGTPCERVLRSTVRGVDPAWLDVWLDRLERHVAAASASGVRASLAEMCEAPAADAVLPGAAVVR
jgi:FlaA1/EpsC-like NDP-sugar epimerase